MINRTPQRGVKVSLLDIMILLHNICAAADRKDIGFEDANHTLNTLTLSLGAKMMVELADVESALWSCNLLAEKKHFWHPSGLDFKIFVQQLLGPNHKFNTKYNWVE